MSRISHEVIKERAIQHLLSVFPVEDFSEFADSSDRLRLIRYLKSLPNPALSPPKDVSLNAFSKNLKDALKYFHYYQVDEIPKGPTLYQRLREKHLVNAVLSPANFKSFKQWWDLLPIIQKEKELHQSKRSHHGHPLSFHRRRIAKLLTRISSLKTQLQPSANLQRQY